MGTFPEFGDFRDNASALAIALWKLSDGEEETGCRILSALRDHIMQTGDLKSAVWLLPSIMSAL